MTSYETIQFLQRFISVVKDKPNLSALLATAESKHSVVKTWVRRVLAVSDSNKAWPEIAELDHRLINEFAVGLKETRSRKLYGELEQMLSEIESLRTTYGESINILKILYHQLTVFIDLYEVFLHQTSWENVLVLVEDVSLPRLHP